MTGTSKRPASRAARYACRRRSGTGNRRLAALALRERRTKSAQDSLPRIDSTRSRRSHQAARLIGVGSVADRGRLPDRRHAGAPTLRRSVVRAASDPAGSLAWYRMAQTRSAPRKTVLPGPGRSGCEEDRPCRPVSSRRTLFEIVVLKRRSPKDGPDPDRASSVRRSCRVITAPRIWARIGPLLDLVDRLDQVVRLQCEAVRPIDQDVSGRYGAFTVMILRVGGVSRTIISIAHDRAIASFRRKWLSISPRS